MIKMTYSVSFDLTAYDTEIKKHKSKELSIRLESSLSKKNFVRLTNITKTTDLWYCRWYHVDDVFIEETGRTRKVIQFYIRPDNMPISENYKNNNQNFIAFKAVIKSNEWNHLFNFSKRYRENSFENYQGRLKVQGNWALDFLSKKSEEVCHSMF
ncbi:hypothetical protein [Lactococcus fujiensis]|uniref:Uncharacterized protein n=1 Tax=Lactococcus fujiensis JCM 16395 TaxID=1291764 RepID=A0A2A5RII1_9LACT|nr:hypothetical protein [Lactococcus fujiensis]PCR98883.1 hypothetical protein RT41_GL000622 [Lactococcus fujiensis JCM 16395]